MTNDAYSNDGEVMYMWHRISMLEHLSSFLKKERQKMASGFAFAEISLNLCKLAKDS